MIKRIAGCSFLILLLGGLCLFVFSAKNPPVQSFRMADGSPVTLAAVTYSSNQTVLFGKTPQKILYQILPAKWKRLARVSAHKFTHATPDVPNFWFFLTNAPDYFEVHPIDVFGCELDGPQPFAMSQEYVPPNFIAGGGYVFRYQFPGRAPNGSIVGLAIYDPKFKSNKLATVFVPDARYIKIPEDKSNIVSRQIDGVTFELKQFVTDLPCGPFVLNGVMTRTNRFTQTVFHISKNGRQATDWTVSPYSILIRDSHGNMRPFGWNLQVEGFKGDDLVVNVNGVLDAAQGPYKVSIQFKRHEITVPVEFEATPVVFSARTASRIEVTQKANTPD